jgi:hypothetical protein
MKKGDGDSASIKSRVLEIIGAGGGMKKGDLVRVKDDVVPMLFHDSSLSNYTLGGGGDVVVVVEPNRVGGCGVYAQVLHPKLGVCYIRKQRLEVIDDTSPTLRPAMQLAAGCGITPPGGGHESR